MAGGRILIVHNSKAVRSILRRRTLAETPEFVIDEAESAEDATAELLGGTFDIIICDEALAGLGDSEWLGEWKGHCGAVEPGYIFLISEATTPSRKGELAEFGPHAFLDAQCTGGDISAAIAKVYDPRHRRKHRRVCIPGTQARMRLGSTVLGVNIVNISVAGMLCESPCPSEFGVMALPAEVAITLPAGFNATVLDGIQARVLRIQVASRGPGNLPERVRSAWEFFHVPNDTFRTLDAALSIADEEAPPESRAL